MKYLSYKNKYSAISEEYNSEEYKFPAMQFEVGDKAVVSQLGDLHYGEMLEVTGVEGEGEQQKVYIGDIDIHYLPSMLVRLK